MITVYKTNTFKCAQQCITDCLKRIDNANLDVKHVVIVPDRASFEAERNLLAELGGSFSIEVATFRRYAAKVLSVGKKYLSKQAGIIALTKIVAEVKDKFVCYTKGVNSGGFTESAYDTICALKYCKIPPQRLFDENLSGGLKSKLHDIGLLYLAYEDFLREGYVDSSDNLDLLCECLPQNDGVKNTYFYFYDFDNFSAQEFAVLEKLMQYARGVTVACCVSHDPRDAHLYLNDIYAGVLAACEKLSVRPVVVEKTAYENAVAEHIGKNLYRYGERGKKESGDFVRVFCGNNNVQEVYALACKVQQYVRKGGRFSDVYVITSDIENYRNAVATVFKQFDIQYFCDVQAKLSDHVYARFVTDYFDMFRSGFQLKNVLSFVKTPLFSKRDEGVYLFENYCLKYNVRYDFSRFDLGKEDPLYEAAERIRQKLWNTVQNCPVPAAASGREYVDAVRKLAAFSDLSSANAEFTERQRENKLDAESKASAQAEEKFEAVLRETEEIVGSFVMKTEEFLNILTAALASVNISVLPPKGDCVVLANMAKARKHDIAFLALLGANQGKMPIVKSDTKLLSDGNITEMNDKGLTLEPMVFTENKRERFSLFQLLQEPSKGLYVSYAAYDGKESLLPSPFVTQLTEIFTSHGEKLQPEGADEEVYTKRQMLGKLVLNRRRLQDRQPVRMPAFSVLYNHFQQRVDGFCYDKDSVRRVTDGKRLFLSDSTTSVSKLTEFFNCPYKYFFTYGLKIAPREVAELKSSDLGDILHAVLDKYVSSMDLTETDEQTEAAARRHFDEVMRQDFYKGLLKDVSMSNTLRLLKVEAVKMCRVVKSQQRHSDFRTFATEFSFGGNSGNAPVEVDFGQGRFLLNGKIDRIDCFDGKFIIIDYKSGSYGSTFDENMLYVGQKLQLPVYLKAAQNHLKMQPVGFYYFNLHNNFTDAKKVKVYSYNGRTLADNDVIGHIDTDFRTGKSDRLGLSLTKEGEINGRQKDKVMTAKQFEAETDYAMRLIAKAGREMQNGYIAVSPCGKTCDFCDYKSICDFGDVLLSGKRETDFAVSAEILEQVTENEK